MILNLIAVSSSVISLAMSIYVIISWRKNKFLDVEDFFDALMEMNDGNSDSQFMLDDEPTDKD